MYNPIIRKRIYIDVAEQIIKMIRDGQIPPQRKLPTERELGVLFGVSRASVREALSALEFMGVVESRVGDGTYVSRSANAPARGMALLSEQHSPSEIMDVRLMIEPLGAGLSALNRTDQDLLGLRLALREMEQGVEECRSTPEPDQRFHLIVAGASGNSVLESIIQFLFSLTRETMWQLLKEPVEKNPDFQKLYYKHHAQLLRAIESGDQQAAGQAMREHLLQVREDVFNGAD